MAPKVSDNWADKSSMTCSTCQFYAAKEITNQDNDRPSVILGRCRRHAPTMGGFPVVFLSDWCGDHKLGTAPRPEGQ